MPKYKFPEIQQTPETSETTNNPPPTATTDAQGQEIDKLRVNLFSRWGEDSGKTDENTAAKIERSQDVVNYSTGDMDSEVEMLDSSTAHIEYN